MSKRLVAALGVLGLLVLAGIVVAVTGVDRSTSPSAARRPPSAVRKHHGELGRTKRPSTATTTPSTANSSSLPLGSWNLPAPKRYEGVVGVGFPHTTLGAVAMGFNALSALVNLDPDIAVSVVRDTALDPTPAQLAEEAQVVEQFRAQYGLPPTGPTSATASLSLEACRVQSVSPDRVVAGYEGTFVLLGPSIQGFTANWAKTIALVWTGSDWRVDPNSLEAPPPFALPGTPGAAADGWHPCWER